MKYDENYFKLNNRVGMLTILSLNPVEKDKQGRSRRYCDCVCDCGKEVKVYAYNLVKQQTKSCGCNRYPIGENSNCWKGKGIVPGREWSNIKRNAKNRNILVKISLDYISDLFEKQNRKCALTGLPLLFESRTKKSDGTASLDRIDSSKGYIEGNVQWVHKDINLMKLDHNQSRFVELCKLVSNYNLL
jgi:hypothetical protein